MLNHQRGSALLVSLILLLLLTIVGVSAMQMTSLEERMSGNYRDHQIAFQAAEAALVEAEAFIENTTLGLSNFAAACSGGNCFKSDCAGGLCFDGSIDGSASGGNSGGGNNKGGGNSGGGNNQGGGNSGGGQSGGGNMVQNCGLGTSKPWTTNVWTTAGKYRTATAIPETAANAKYIIEFRCFTPRDPSATVSTENPEQWTLFFRVTALATGGTTNSQVMLQTTYKKLNY